MTNFSPISSCISSSFLLYFLYYEPQIGVGGMEECMIVKLDRLTDTHKTDVSAKKYHSGGSFDLGTCDVAAYPNSKGTISN